MTVDSLMKPEIGHAAKGQSTWLFDLVESCQDPDGAGAGKINELPTVDISGASLKVETFFAWCTALLNSIRYHNNISKMRIDNLTSHGGNTQLIVKWRMNSQRQMRPLLIDRMKEVPTHTFTLLEVYRLKLWRCLFQPASLAIRISSWRQTMSSSLLGHDLKNFPDRFPCFQSLQPFSIVHRLFKHLSPF